MIRSIRVTDPAKSCVPWWSSVPWLKGKAEIEFKPGLNILYGPNGSGKTTVLTLLARTLCCEQGNVQKVTSQAIRELESFSVRSFGDERRVGVLPVHDGSPVLHFDPNKAVGLLGGAFDDDFFLQGLQNAMHKGSAGQTTLRRMDDILGAALQDKWPSLEIPPRCPTWIAELLKGTGDKERPTLLLDEPSRSLDVAKELRLMEILSLLAPRVQIIMASHSLFALLQPDAFFIDTEPNYSILAREQLDIRTVAAIRKQPGRMQRIEKFLDEHPLKVEPLPDPAKLAAKVAKAEKAAAKAAKAKRPRARKKKES